MYVVHYTCNVRIVCKMVLYACFFDSDSLVEKNSGEALDGILESHPPKYKNKKLIFNNVYAYMWVSASDLKPVLWSMHFTKMLMFMLI